MTEDIRFTLSRSEKVRRQGKKAGLRYHIDQIASEHGPRGSSNITKLLQEIGNEKENDG